MPDPAMLDSAVLDPSGLGPVVLLPLAALLLLMGASGWALRRRRAHRAQQTAREYAARLAYLQRVAARQPPPPDSPQDHAA